jgi:hypothetical protein
LTATDRGGGSWQFNGLSFASIAASRGSSGANSDVVASAQIAYQIAFSLGLGESATVSLDLGYSLSEVGLNGTLGWNFTGPAGTIAEISGSVGSAATTQNLPNQTIPSQQVLISTPGTYTFNLTGSMPSQTTNKSESVSLVLNSIDLQITSIPEPGARAITALGLGMLVARRRRIRV